MSHASLMFHLEIEGVGSHDQKVCTYYVANPVGETSHTLSQVAITTCWDIGIAVPFSRKIL